MQVYQRVEQRVPPTGFIVSKGKSTSSIGVLSMGLGLKVNIRTSIFVVLGMSTRLGEVLYEEYLSLQAQIRNTNRNDDFVRRLLARAESCVFDQCKCNNGRGGKAESTST